MCNAIGTSPPECIAEPEGYDWPKPTVEVNAVYYRDFKALQMQIKRHMKVEHENGEQKVHGWRNEVKINLESDAYLDNFNGTMTEF